MVLSLKNPPRLKTFQYVLLLFICQQMLVCRQPINFTLTDDKQTIFPFPEIFLTI